MISFIVKIKKFEKSCLFLLLIFFSSCVGKTDQNLISFTARDKDSTTKEITIAFVVPEKDFIYKDFISCSVQEPEIELSPWKANKQTSDYYDPLFNITKEIFNETFSISFTATKKELRCGTAHIHCNYYRKADNRLDDIIFAVTFEEPCLATHIETQNAEIQLFPGITTHQSPTDSFFADTHACTSAVRDVMNFCMSHHKKCVSLFILLTILLCILFIFYADRLQKHARTYDLIEMMLYVCITTITISLLLSAYNTHHVYLQLMSISCSVFCATITGLVYIKKSMKFKSGFFHTFYTAVGMLCIMSALFLIFKTIQFVDVRMGCLF
jgi:hypothetical protein